MAGNHENCGKGRYDTGAGSFTQTADDSSVSFSSTHHPAMGAIILNLSANMLGLGNAATPFGMKAMRELQNLNQGSDNPSEAMCTFLALNTSCITLLPATIIGVRLSYHSAHPAEIVGPCIFATAIAMCIGITLDYWFRTFSPWRDR